MSSLSVRAAQEFLKNCPALPNGPASAGGPKMATGVPAARRRGGPCAGVSTQPQLAVAFHSEAVAALPSNPSGAAANAHFLPTYCPSEFIHSQQFLECGRYGNEFAVSA